MLNRFIFSFLVIIFFCSCNKQKILDAKPYCAYIENKNNGASEKNQIDDYEFSILYKPIDYVIELENRNKAVSMDSISKRKKELKGYQYYTFRIRSLIDNEFLKTGLRDDNEYYQRLEYYVSNAQDDFKLIQGKDTLNCLLYHFERNYGVSPYSSIVLTFNEPDSALTTDKILVYDDKVLGIGKVSIKLNGKKLKELPVLKI